MANKFTPRTEPGEIRIPLVPADVYNELNAMAANTGVPLASLLKTHLRELVDGAPVKLKTLNVSRET